jgi:exodeoxyribonuclease VIII
MYLDLPNSDYHGGSGTSKSGLDLIHKSAELFDFVKHAKPEDRESTPDQVFGSAYHAIVLEPKEFVRTYALGLRMQDVPEAIDSREVLVGMVEKLNEGRLPKLPTSGAKADQVERILAAWPEHDIEVTDASRAALDLLKGNDLKAELDRLNATRPGKLSTSGSRHELADILRANGIPVTLWSDVQAQWAANNQGRVVLSEEDWIALHAMRDKVFQHPAAGALLRKPGRSEVSFYWVDQETGEELRCRPDRFTECGLILDLKSTIDASPTGFVSSIQKWRYDVQDPFYVDGVNEAIRQGNVNHKSARGFIFIAQEKKPPYSVGVYVLDKEDADLGRLEYRADLRRLNECRQANAWPGYSNRIEQISLKAWHRQETALAASAALN